MELRAALAARRMTRSFRPEPVADEEIRELLERARHAPSAGNTQSMAFLLLCGAETERYWRVTLSEQRRAEFPWPGLLEAPVLVLLLTDPSAYVRRYSEADKSASGLGDSDESWPVPYWFVDSGCVLQNILLLAADEGLGALLFGTFEHESAVRSEFGIPDSHRIVGVVAMGHPTEQQRPSASASRSRPAFDQILHVGQW